MDAQTLSWRTQQLERAGYSSAQASELAAGRCDLHEAVQLLKAGCPRDVAFDICSDEQEAA